MVHFTTAQFEEVRSRFQRIIDKASQKGLWASLDIELYSRGINSFDAGGIRIYEDDNKDSLYYKNFTSIQDTEDDEYNRAAYFKYVGFIRGLEEAEAFVDNYKKEA